MSIQIDGVEARCVVCEWRAVCDSHQAARAAGRRHREDAGDGPGKGSHVVVVDEP